MGKDIGIVLMQVPDVGSGYGVHVHNATESHSQLFYPRIDKSRHGKKIEHLLVTTK
jgi:hypothetical protein